MKYLFAIVWIALLSVVVACARTQPTPTPTNTPVPPTATPVPQPVGKVSFAEPLDGAKVVSPFWVRMGAEGVTVEPASSGVREGYGHHHILVDAETPKPGQPIPSDATHLHFGKGQTQTSLELPPGEHTLRMVFAKGDHIPYDPFIVSTAKVTVTERRKVSFLEPANGAQIKSPFTVKMAAEGVVIEPAAEGVHDGRGHHHLILDTDLPPNGQPIPSNAQHLHYGKGQIETTLDLPPGQHTLRLAFAKGDHFPYDPPITDTVTITVVQ